MGLNRFSVALLALLLLGSSAFADSIFGGCNKDGVRISTSWNSKETYSRNGEYQLDLGGVVNSDVTIYVNGSVYKRVYVTKATRVDIDAKKK